MTIKNTLYLGVAAITLAVSGAAYSAQNDANPLQIAQNGTLHYTTYISGGVGKESQDNLMQNDEAYNLKVTVASDKGHYLSDVPMTVSDNSGAVIINTVTDGPLLYADLDAGTYTVSAVYNGIMKTQKVSISENTDLRQIVFQWPTVEDALEG